jgi:hypothetical protein
MLLLLALCVLLTLYCTLEIVNQPVGSKISNSLRHLESTPIGECNGGNCRPSSSASTATTSTSSSFSDLDMKNILSRLELLEYNQKSN